MPGPRRRGWRRSKVPAAARVPDGLEFHGMARKAPGITLLGKQTELPDSPEKAVLERVPNPHPDTRYVARFTRARVHLAVPGDGPAGLRAPRHRLRAEGLAGRNRSR